MATSVEKIQLRSLSELTGDSPQHTIPSNTPFSVYSKAQYTTFQTTFSHSLAQLQNHLNLLLTGQTHSADVDLLTSTMVSMVRAMFNYLQRSYTILERLDGLGRVVETEDSKTWYAQADRSYLRKTVADLKAKCDAFTWVVGEICQARKLAEPAPLACEDMTPAAEEEPPRHISYNSFSSIGSEQVLWVPPRKRGRQAESRASTPVTNPFSDPPNSLPATPAWGTDTGPTTVNPTTPIEALEKQSLGIDDGQELMSDPEVAYHLLPAALREVLDLNFS